MRQRTDGDAAVGADPAGLAAELAARYADPPRSDFQQV